MYISLEGLDGAGKTTVVNFLKRKFNCVVFKTSPIYNPFKALEKERAVSRLLTLSDELFIIRDRSILTTLVYGSLTVQPEDFDSYMKAATDVINEVKLPDLIIFLQVTPQTSLVRKLDLYSVEQLERLQTLYLSFLDLMKQKTTVCIVNGELPIDTVRREVLKIIKQYLKKEEV